MVLPAKKVVITISHVRFGYLHRIKGSNYHFLIETIPEYTRKARMILSFHILVAVRSEHAIPVLIIHPTQHD